MGDLTNDFPPWGETGEFPASGFFYEGGDQVNEKHLDALWNGTQVHLSRLIDGIRDRVSNIEGDVLLDNGLSVSTGSGTREIDVTASTEGAYVDGQRTESTSAKTLTLSTGGPRTDSIWVDTEGQVGKTEGTTSVSDTRHKIAEVDVGSGDTITEVRNTGRNIARHWSTDYLGGEQVSIRSGDLWHDTSANRIKARQGGSWRTLITEQDSITITSGTGLSGGGSINLFGGSTTLNVSVGNGIKNDTNNNVAVEPVDFAGDGLKDDGGDDLSIEPADFAGSGVEDDGNDNLKVSDSITNATVPSGGILVWSGSISNIPSGWVLCDGNNGTPNLQDRFVVGAGGGYSVGQTGGESFHTLSESELASHSHEYDARTSSGTETGQDGSGVENLQNTTNTGGNSAHENKPPYYALAYIMKV